MGFCEFSAGGGDSVNVLPVIASEAKQSTPQHGEKMDCFVASRLARTK
jgi:hypothetical protein